MNVNPAHKPLALEPVQDSTDDKDPAAAKARRALRITSADEFIKAAAKEYEEGQVDPALWRQAGDQCGRDPSLVVPAYLRARATALKLQQKQNERPPTQARSGSAGGASARKIESERLPKRASTEIAHAHPWAGQPALKYLAGGAAALVAIGIVVWLIASPRESASVRPPVVAAAAPAQSRSAPPTPRISGQPAAGETQPRDLDPSAFEARLQDLKKTGNWNVVALHAVDWTRKQPENAAAWRELSVAYVNLRQYGDALDAAKKAVQVAPEDSSLWSSLGQIDLTLNRLPEAASAFDRALTLSPDHPDALCGAASVAQKQGRPSDADAFARRVKSDEGCRGVSEVASAASVASGSATRKPAPAVGR